MIALIGNEIPAFVTGNDPVSGRLLSWWEAYHSTPVCRFYRTENGGCIAIMDAQAVACVPQEDAEETAAFLNIQPEIGCVYTNLSGAFLGKEKRFTAMQASADVRAERLETVKLQELYSFLQPLFPDLPPFEAWYLDTSYRTRHGLCRHTVIKEAGQIASCAMTVAEWPGGALIGGVATHPDYRRRGYAGRCVSALTSMLREMGKIVWICPYNLPAQRLYQSLGFKECGTVTVMERT